MELTTPRVRALRLHAHYLDQPLPADGLLQAAGACGLQNSPPGAWETAAFNRVEGCSVCSLHTALYHDRTLLQAWSWRGVPAVFPTRDAGVFLTPLCARPGEDPWIYTKGIGLALDFLGMSFEELQQCFGFKTSLTDGSSILLSSFQVDVQQGNLGAAAGSGLSKAAAQNTACTGNNNSLSSQIKSKRQIHRNFLLSSR